MKQIWSASVKVVAMRMRCWMRWVIRRRHCRFPRYPPVLGIIKLSRHENRQRRQWDRLLQWRLLHFRRNYHCNVYKRWSILTQTFCIRMLIRTHSYIDMKVFVVVRLARAQHHWRSVPVRTVFFSIPILQGPSYSPSKFELANMSWRYAREQRLSSAEV